MNTTGQISHTASVGSTNEYNQ